MRDNIVIFSQNTHNFLVNEINNAKKVFNRIVIICPYNQQFEKALSSFSNIEYIFYNKKDLYKNIIFSLKNVFKKQELKEVFHSITNRSFTLEYLKHYVYFLGASRLFEKSLVKRLHLTLQESKKWIFYSAWYYSTAYAITEAKKKYKHALTVSLAHSFEVDEVKNKFIKLLFRDIYHKKLDKVSFISNNVYELFKRQIAPSLGLSLNNTEVRYLGTKKLIPGYSNYSRDGIIRIVSCSNLVEVKRVDLIFHTLDTMKENKIEWIHIGIGDKMKYLRKLVQNKTNDNLVVKFLGLLENTKVHEYYVNNPVDVFLNVSSSEGIPVSIMEAIAYGIPVIATDVGGNSEIVKEDFGLLISSNPTCEEIKKAIIKIVNSSETEKKERQKKAINFFEKYLNSDKIRYEFFLSLKNDY